MCGAFQLPFLGLSSAVDTGIDFIQKNAPTDSVAAIAADIVEKVMDQGSYFSSFAKELLTKPLIIFVNQPQLM
jgi:hypothetical protein